VALPGALASCACRWPLPGALFYQINMKYYMKTGVTGVETRDARTSEFSNLKTGTLEVSRVFEVINVLNLWLNM
jgi:hypothetical protein